MIQKWKQEFTLSHYLSQQDTLVMLLAKIKAELSEVFTEVIVHFALLLAKWRFSSCKCVYVFTLMCCSWLFLARPISHSLNLCYLNFNFLQYPFLFSALNHTCPIDSPKITEIRLDGLILPQSSSEAPHLVVSPSLKFNNIQVTASGPF